MKPKADREPTWFEMDKVVRREDSEANLYLGTSSFTADGWAGTFYPKGKHAKTFRAVEIDSTFYATPSETTLLNWYERTPADFVFAAKVPQVITREKMLQDCDKDIEKLRNNSKRRTNSFTFLKCFPLK